MLLINLDKNIEESGKLVGTTGDSVISINTPKTKSSSGLSAGAIAGIVVGGVVVLLGISIVTIICWRKSRQIPLDNTTAIDVKTIERIYIWLIKFFSKLFYDYIESLNWFKKSFIY